MKIQHGKQKVLADRAGISETVLADILSGHKGCPGRVAVKLEQVSEEILGRHIPAREWILAGLGYTITQQKDGGENGKVARTGARKILIGK